MYRRIVCRENVGRNCIVLCVVLHLIKFQNRRITEVTITDTHS